ncbi:GNAT family N-acetyltransferase [Granulosicoccus sp. 3-233]|uniref:GNAT family N-acetyltransferase n=1 Tax=Granulosicoccus sp. 3-233 TaxID=3417969 RepID=UPI003D355FB5
MNIRFVTSDDAEAFSALRRDVTRENPVAMGLSYDEELTRTLEDFKAQLSFTHPNAMFGSFVEGKLAATAAVGLTSRSPSSCHKMLMWGVLTSPAFRRRGLGRKLVESAIQHAFGNGIHRVNLQVYVPNEPAAYSGEADHPFWPMVITA